MSSGNTGVGPSWSGTAIVCCIHDRVKREVTTEAEVALIGLSVGQIYNPKQHKIHKCSCCENLFVDPSDVPMYCHQCRARPVHAVGGPIPDPIGVIDG